MRVTAPYRPGDAPAQPAATQSAPPCRAARPQPHRDRGRQDRARLAPPGREEADDDPRRGFRLRTYETRALLPAFDQRTYSTNSPSREYPPALSVVHRGIPLRRNDHSATLTTPTVASRRRTTPTASRSVSRGMAPRWSLPGTPSASRSGRRTVRRLRHHPARRRGLYAHGAGREPGPHRWPGHGAAQRSISPW